MTLQLAPTSRGTNGLESGLVHSAKAESLCSPHSREGVQFSSIEAPWLCGAASAQKATFFLLLTKVFPAQMYMYSFPYCLA